MKHPCDPNQPIEALCDQVEDGVALADAAKAAHTANLLHPDSASQKLQDTAYADSGCTSHFLKSNSHCIDEQVAHNGMRVKLADGKIIQATCTPLLDSLQLPIQARRVHIFRDLQNSALLSMSQAFCDNNCEARFTKTNVTTFQKDSIILQGERDSVTGLWQLDLQPLSLQIAHAANKVTL
jgi:hypothetical protein